jgi:hypothetical protein
MQTNGKQTKQNIFSATKNITSALVGISLEKTEIKDIDQQLNNIFPKLNHDEGVQVKIQKVTTQLMNFLSFQFHLSKLTNLYKKIYQFEVLEILRQAKVKCLKTYRMGKYTDHKGGIKLLLTKRSNAQRLMITLVAFSILVIPIGCSKATNEQSQAPSATQNATSPNTTPSPIKTEDKELTLKLTSEKIVNGGRVYLDNNFAIATINLKKGTDVTVAKILAQKYADILKQKYDKKKINVQAVLDNKNIANINL